MKFCFFLGILFFATAADAADGVALNLEQARQLALKHNPRITAAELQSLAARESITEARAAYFPTITANATAVGTSQDNTRIAAGSLSNPGIFERNAEGVAVSQLITDFGRTGNLTASAKLRSSAEQAGLETVREQVVLLTDTAYFEALRAASVLDVAKQTLVTRQTLLDQVSALASNKLKSELDVNFARVATDEARILMLQSESELHAAHARLAMLTGLDQSSVFLLRDVATNIFSLPDVSKVISEALERRPELRQLELTAQAARKLAKAERASGHPTLSAIGGAGVIPLHDSHFEDYYAAGGVNLSVPIFAGGLYSARAKEAQYKADANEELLQARREEVARDIRIASLVVNTAAERIKVAERLVNNANETYSLAEAKYSIGSASIVELSQAQLSKTLAQIEAATARYNYQIQLSNFNFQAGTVAPAHKS
ncbi:MAG TPA: TolC family protein [Verrucomicrobiae bacterium]